MKHAAFLQTGCLIKWFEQKGMPVHPGMREICQTLGKELDLDNDFLRLDP
jgi:hypothetical protein